MGIPPVDLASGGIDANAEPRDLAVSEHATLAVDHEVIHDTFGERSVLASLLDDRGALRFTGSGGSQRNFEPVSKTKATGRKLKRIEAHPRRERKGSNGHTHFSYSP